MLTVMKAELANDPVLRTITNPKDGRELKVVDANIAYQKEAEGSKTFVRAVAWETVAEQLASKKKGDVIEFAGKLTYNNYKNPTMEKPRKVLGFSIQALDDSGTLCQKVEQFMGVQRRPYDKPGAVFQPMRGKLHNAPVLTQVEGKDGKPLDVCNATVLYWNGKRGESNAFVSITAYDEVARMLSQMEPGSPIQFVGRLDSQAYRNEQMDHSHLELCYNVYSIDPDLALVSRTEQFIREEAGLAKPPFRDLVQNAEDRKAAPQSAGMNRPAKEVAEPVM